MMIGYPDRSRSCRRSNVRVAGRRVDALNPDAETYGCSTSDRGPIIAFLPFWSRTSPSYLTETVRGVELGFCS